MSRTDTYTKDEFAVSLKSRGIFTRNKDINAYLEHANKSVYAEDDFADAYHWNEYDRYAHSTVKHPIRRNCVDGQNRDSMSNDLMIGTDALPNRGRAKTHYGHYKMNEVEA